MWRASAFAESASDSNAPSGARFAQVNLSLSKAGVLRGLHYHRHQLDHWIVAEGRVFVALVDLRSSTVRPTVLTRVLGVDETVTIPVFVAHGFLASEPTTLMYLVTKEYDGTDEHGLAWDDPDVGITWPTASTTDGSPVLSSRDRSNPRLADVRRSMIPSS